MIDVPLSGYRDPCDHAAAVIRIRQTFGEAIFHQTVDTSGDDRLDHLQFVGQHADRAIAFVETEQHRDLTSGMIIAVRYNLQQRDANVSYVQIHVLKKRTHLRAPLSLEGKYSVRMWSKEGRNQHAPGCYQRLNVLASEMLRKTKMPGRKAVWTR